MSHRDSRLLTRSSSPPRQSSPVADTESVEKDQDRSQAQKRKASSPPPDAHAHAHVSTVTSKRGRIDGALNERGANSGASHLSKDTSAGRRQSASQEEKRRGKRLFGSFLNSLSQTSRRDGRTLSDGNMQEFPNSGNNGPRMTNRDRRSSPS